MKILFSLHHFLPDTVAGTEVYVYQLAKNLQLLGQEVIIVIPNFDKSINEEYEYEQLRIIKYAENSVDDRMMILGYKKPLGLEAFKSILQKEQPDIVHFHELIGGRGSNIHHAKEVKKLSLPIVLTTHLTFYTCSTGKLLINDKLPCDGEIRIERCTKCILQSKEMAPIKTSILNTAGNLIYNLGINPLELNSSVSTAIGVPWLVKRKQDELNELSKLCNAIVAPAQFYYKILALNGVPKFKLHHISQGLPSGVEKPATNIIRNTKMLRLIYAGRITEIKGLIVLLEAIQLLNDKTIYLDIYGTYGKEESYYETCVAIASNNSNIQFKGSVKAESIVSIMAEYDILCLPSLFEMSPLVIQEAFAAGIPVLASDVYGNAEQIEDDVNGWLFKFKDANNLAEKLQQLIDNPALIEQSHKHLPAAKSFKDVAIEYMEVYNSVLQETTKTENEKIDF